MAFNEKFFTQLGYTERQAKDFVETLSEEAANSMKFYRLLGYSLIESEYLAMNVFNTVQTHVAQEMLGVPIGFSKTRSFTGPQVLNSVVSKASIDTLTTLMEECSPDGEFDMNLNADEQALCDGFFGCVDEDCMDEDYMEDVSVDCAFGETPDFSTPDFSYNPFAIDPKSIAMASPLVGQIAPEEVYNRVTDESQFKEVLTSPTSTIRATVNTASFNYIKDNILRHRQIHKDAIRKEEVLNYFDYDFKDKLNAEVGSFEGKHYLLAGIKGDKVENLKNNIVLVVDASGSMAQSDVLLQKTIMTIVKQLGPDDVISLVTYSTIDKVIFTGIKADRTSDIILSLSKVNIEGCTAGSKGLDRAYEIASEYFIEGGNNRIIIVTDGDFNFGTYNKSELAKFIKEKKDSGVFLTVAGTSRSEVYEEQLMETLAREGNGNYFRISDEDDILETFKNRFLNNSIAIAKDVKIQIEFNPAVVKRYRLIGYETRQLSHEDFKNDNVASETLGNEQVVVALYEIEFTDRSESLQSKFKYQKVSTTDSKDIGTLSFRFKGINDTESKELNLEIQNKESELTQNMIKAILANYFVDFAVNLDKDSYKLVCKLAMELPDDDNKANIIRKLVNTVM